VAALVAGAGGMGGVFDDGDAVLVGKGVQRVEVKGSAGVVHRNDGLGPRCDGGFDACRVGHQGVPINIDKHRCGAEQRDHVGRGHPGLRWGDDFIPRADTQCQQGNMHTASGR